MNGSRVTLPPEVDPPFDVVSVVGAAPAVSCSSCPPGPVVATTAPVASTATSVGAEVPVGYVVVTPAGVIRRTSSAAGWAT